MRITGLQSVVVDEAVEIAAALHDLTVLALHTLEQLEDAHLSAMCPIAFVALIHIFYVLHLVVSYHHIAGRLARLSEVMHMTEHRHIGSTGTLEG